MKNNDNTIIMKKKVPMPHELQLLIYFFPRMLEKKKKKKCVCATWTGTFTLDTCFSSKAEHDKKRKKRAKCHVDWHFYSKRPVETKKSHMDRHLIVFFQ